MPGLLEFSAVLASQIHRKWGIIGHLIFFVFWATLMPPIIGKITWLEELKIVEKVLGLLEFSAVLASQIHMKWGIIGNLIFFVFWATLTPPIIRKSPGLGS